jgi:hypothetical protein
MKAEQLARAVPGMEALSEADREAILEIAYLTIAADHHLTDEELEAFRLLAASTKGAPFIGLLSRFEMERTRDQSVQRLRELGASISEGARETAYRAALALAASDSRAADQEFEFEIDLLDALELPSDKAETIAEEVRRLLAG